MKTSIAASVLPILLSILTLTTATPTTPPPSHSLHSLLRSRTCPAFDPAGAKNVGNAAGQQFIGGQCLSTADCASGCCANPCGICSGPDASFQNGKTGCGFPGASESSSTGDDGDDPAATTTAAAAAAATEGFVTVTVTVTASAVCTD